MADEDTKVDSYIIIQRSSIDELQKAVNKYIEAKKPYVPYGPMMHGDWLWIQVMTLASLNVYKVSAWVWGTMAISGIAWTVTVNNIGN